MWYQKIFIVNIWSEKYLWNMVLLDRLLKIYLRWDVREFERRGELCFNPLLPDPQKVLLAREKEVLICRCWPWVSRLKIKFLELDVVEENWTFSQSVSTASYPFFSLDIGTVSSMKPMNRSHCFDVPLVFNFKLLLYFIFNNYNYNDT